MPRNETATRKARRRFPAQMLRERAACSRCGATPGEPCFDPAGVSLPGVHWQRRDDYRRKIGDLPLRGNVTVTFKCPVCGGPHARAEHA